VAAGVDRALLIAVAEGDDVEVWTWGERAPGEALRPTDRFEIGSITKTFTGTLLADAVLSSEVRLDHTVAELVGADVGPAGDITLAELATHTSGLPRLPCDLDPAAEQPYAAYDRLALLAGLRACGPTETRGTYAYSNLGFGLLGEVLALSLQSEWEALVAERLTGPLGMVDTSTALGDPDRLVLGYADGLPAPAWQFQALAPAGALRSTGVDLLTWLAAFDAGPAADALRLAATPVADVGGSTRVGLGWHRTDLAGVDVIWHNGGTAGFHSFAGRSDARAVVVLAASAAEVDALGLRVLSPEVKLPPAPDRVRQSAAELGRAAGTWNGKGVALNLEAADGFLIGRLPGQPPFALWADSHGRYRMEAADVTIELLPAVEGPPVRAVLRQGRSLVRLKRARP
jgi:CubicO group peptidase (beta-lactamase class C family)